MRKFAIVYLEHVYMMPSPSCSLAHSSYTSPLLHQLIFFSIVHIDKDMSHIMCAEYNVHVCEPLMMTHVETVCVLYICVL